MQKKAESTFSILKFIQKNIKNGKKKAHLFGFFCFYIPCAFFCILNLKIHMKKMQKKLKFFFKFAKYICKKKQKIIFQEYFKAKKKTEMQKKVQKKAGGCMRHSAIYGYLTVNSVILKIPNPKIRNCTFAETR